MASFANSLSLLNDWVICLLFGTAAALAVVITIVALLELYEMAAWPDALRLRHP